MVFEVMTRDIRENYTAKDVNATNCCFFMAL